MLGIVLAKKILSLLLIMLAGFVLVRMKILRSGDSKTLSLLSLYLIMPCMLISAFQIECTPEIEKGMLLALAAAVVIHIILILLGFILKKGIHLDPVEQTSIIYSNAGNLVIPLVSALLGDEWVIYSSAFLSVQLFLLFSHARTLLSSHNGIELKTILTNVNMVAIYIGLFLFITGIQLPSPVQDTLSNVCSMAGPVAMLITGMLIGSKKLTQVFTYRRLWMVVGMRLVVFPLLILLLLKYGPLAAFSADGKSILLISLLATSTPSASSLTQMTQVYGQDADYASAINLTTTLCCIVSMPLLVALYTI